MTHWLHVAVLLTVVLTGIAAGGTALSVVELLVRLVWDRPSRNLSAMRDWRH